MASPSPLCDLCLQLNSSRTAEYWCFTCGECICSECEHQHRIQNATKEHKPITIDEYQKLPATVTSVKQVCSDHDKKIEFYCKDHDFPCCLSCVSSTHRKCGEVKPLEDVVRNVKESFSVEDLQSRIEDIPELTKQLTEDLTDEKSRVNSESQRVITEVIDVRANIDQHLDRIQAQLLEQVKTNRDEQFRRIDERMVYFKRMEDETNKMSSDFKTLVNYSSNSHVYLTMNTIEAEISQFEDKIREVQKKNNESFDSMKLQITPEILRLMKNVEQFGIAEMKYRKSSTYRPKKEQQGQKLVCNQRIMLDKVASFVIEGVKEKPRLAGCCITESGELIIADYNNSRLVQTTAQGKLIKNICLTFQPDDVKQVDKSTVAVSSSSDKKIVLVDTKKGKTLKTVYKGERCWGFSYNDGIYTVSTGFDKTILTIDSKGKIMSTILNTDYGVYSCCVKDDKLYYTEPFNDTVVCSDMKGNVIWKYKCDYGDCPIGIMVEPNNNVFVACRYVNRVIAIDKSGKESKVVLSKDDGMDYPYALYLCEKSRSLLVCNEEGSCFLYNLC